MNKTLSTCGRKLVRRLIVLAALGLATLCAPALRADIKLDVLKTASGSYSNVTVFTRTSTHLSFSHAGGVAVIKLSEINADSIAAINGSNTASAAAGAVVLNGHKSSATEPSYTPAKDGARLHSLTTALTANPLLKRTLGSVSRNIIFAVLGGMLVGWLLLCFCFHKICKKAGAEPGVLVWLPVLQLFPLLRAAQLPLWWFVIWFIPIANLVAQVVWCVRISEARGKSPWLGVLLILPVTNLFALLYLAFSGTGASGEKTAPAPFGTPRPAAA
ncbi:MAG: hypothetical protein EPO07_00375 [Verrucomicrobia bacterium]|nr:MAG: hypothetical protein EPO07_00375 [Verrucomicrobiota bacterium]